MTPPYVWTPPICLAALLYVWMTKHAFFVLCAALLYVLDTAHMFGCPPYVLMAKHAFFVLCVTLLTTCFSLLPCPVYCPKSLTVLQLDWQPKLEYNDIYICLCIYLYMSQAWKRV